MAYDNQVRSEYFEWLYNYVCNGRTNESISYIKLFELLHSTEFTYIIRKDMNRARDGIDLRYRFAMTRDDDSIMDVLEGPCSVLEMVLALAIRCEETIMDNIEYGDRTAQWFWNMLHSIGISRMSDDIFDEEFVREKIEIFLNREYEPDGKGGLFYIKNCTGDLRELEIWSQLCWYLYNYI